MMKKRMKDQHDDNKNNQNQPIDIKENTQTTESIDEKGQDTPVTGQKENNVPETATVEIAAPDKVVTPEKSSDEKLAELQDKYLRLSAEFDNYRKRTLREKMDLSKYATETVLLRIIPFMDDFERALKHMDSTTDCVAMKSGIDLIYSKFSEFFRQNGIKEIESLDCDFNVDLHEAVAKVPVEEEQKKGKVVDVVLKGYYLQDKVLRFAKVVVGE
jgi:molecular chaperone GrpE